MAAGPFIQGCRNSKLKLPPLKETYRNDDKNPFGGYVAYQEVGNFFENVKAVYQGGPSVEQDVEADDEKGERSLYMIVSDELIMADSDVEWVIRYVTKGNDLFLSANLISNNLLKKLRIKTSQVFARMEEQMGNMKDTQVKIYFGKNLPVVPFTYFYYSFNNHLQSFVEGSTVIQGTNGDNQPNFIIIFIGKGRLYLHLAPRALSNYFLLTKDNVDYLHHILNFFRSDPEVVYWDEYYKRLGNASNNKDADKSFSSLRVIMSHKYLKWAFFIAAGGLVMFLFSNMKRRQRMIPRQTPPSNASVDFVETVARLYYVNKDNKNIAGKLITYFYEYVRTRYFLRSGHKDDSFAARLAGKKGMKPEEIQELITCIRQAEQQNEVSDDQLLRLNQLLENFYNHK